MRFCVPLAFVVACAPPVADPNNMIPPGPSGMSGPTNDETVQAASAPTFSPGASASATPIAVTISCTNGSPFHTTDGSTPTESSTAGGSVTFNATGTLSAICAGGGFSASPVTTATYTVIAGGFETHGFLIPPDHPRLWWTDDRIQAAQTWLSSHSYGGTNVVDTAMKHVLAGADCTSAVNQALAWAPPAGQVLPTAIGSDAMRGEGEAWLLVFDWCYDQFSVAQRTTFRDNWNTWVGNVMQQDWGGVGMSANNYFWGNLRNELEWGIISYGENPSAEGFIDNALDVRFADFAATTTAGGLQEGGVLLEGDVYGAAQLQYMIVPIATLHNFGRDLLDETAYYDQFSYWLLYWTTPTPTVTVENGNEATYVLATVNEQDKMECGGMLYCRNYFEDWMAFYAQLAGAPRAGHARQWLSKLSPVAPLQYNPNATSESNYYVSNYIISNDPGGAATPYSSLPLDYYAKGVGYGSTRSAWNDTSTVVWFFMNTDKSLVGHWHDDWGSFSMWRNGRWMMRETAGYSKQLQGTPGIAAGALQDSGSQLAHNVPVFTNVALGQDSQDHYTLPTRQKGPTVTRRMQSDPDFFYIDTDLTNVYLWEDGYSHYNTGVVAHVERELFYLRAHETLVVLDRITTAAQTHGGALAAEDVITSAVTHFETLPDFDDNNHLSALNGDDLLRQTILLPSALGAQPRVVTEGSSVGQYRVEVDASGTAQRYHLSVLQSSADVTAALLAGLQDNGTSWTVTLGASTSIVINKGMTSSGGSIAINGGSAVNLRADVQPVTYGPNGISW